MKWFEIFGLIASILTVISIGITIVIVFNTNKRNKQMDARNSKMYEFEKQKIYQEFRNQVSVASTSFENAFKEQNGKTITGFKFVDISKEIPLLNNIILKAAKLGFKDSEVFLLNQQINIFRQQFSVIQHRDSEKMMRLTGGRKPLRSYFDMQKLGLGTFGNSLIEFTTLLSYLSSDEIDEIYNEWVDITSKGETSTISLSKDKMNQEDFLWGNVYIDIVFINGLFLNITAGNVKKQGEEFMKVVKTNEIHIKEYMRFIKAVSTLKNQNNIFEPEGYEDK